MLETAVLSMLEGEQALVTLDNPSIQVRLQLISFINSSTIPEWTADKCIEVATKLKQVGVDVFQQGHIHDAFLLFSQSLRVLTLGEGVDTQLSSTLSCNMAACQLQLDNFELAAELCEVTLKSQPKNRKALYRRGMAAFKMGEFKIADEYANKVLKLEPSNAQAINLLASARDALNSSNVDYQAMTRRMFN
jgi:tetratricopeptide (TPR) repeat protein